MLIFMHLYNNELFFEKYLIVQISVYWSIFNDLHTLPFMTDQKIRKHFQFYKGSWTIAVIKR